MNSQRTAYRVLIFLIALVWILNGLVCKLLNFVPRHREIVAEILGQEYAWVLTKAIGFGEVLMGLWILSGIKPRLNAGLQIFIIAVMNSLEFFLAPDLLLWGRFNAFFALLFILTIYYNEFVLHPKITGKV